MAALLAVARQSEASIIANLATGLDASNTLQTGNGDTDAHWKVQVAGTPQAYVVVPGGADWYGGWVANGPNSSWIARDYTTSNNGVNTYYRDFDLTGYNLSTVTISGSWTLDDQGTLSVNGNQVASLGNGNWGSLSSFSVPLSDLVQGLNTISIAITQSDNYLEGVRLEGTVEGTSAIPEPATLIIWSLFAGLGIALGRLRRRKTA
ncbi:MAG: hypothetical protein ABSG68_10050 [Thermoguttaceae bacterium]